MTTDVENTRQPLFKITTNQREMPHFAKIFQLIKDDDKEELKAQVERESLEMVLMPQDDKEYRTALHAAVEHGAMDCLQMLLDATPSQEALDSPCADGNTPLHVAVDNLNSLAVGKLLKAGAYPNARNDLGHTALHLLAYKATTAVTSDALAGVTNCLTPLLAHADIDLEAINNSKLTPLRAAANKFPSKSSSLEQFCKKLVDAGAIIDEKTQMMLDKNCIPKIVPPTAVHRNKYKAPLADVYDILIQDNSDLIEKKFKLLSKVEARDISNRFFKSTRILYHLVDKCNEDGVVTLLKAGAKPWSRHMKGGELPLHRALARGHHGIVSYLIDYMKKTNPTNMVNSKVDLREESFDLIQKALESSNFRNQSGPEIDSNKCLERLFKSDVLMDVNQKEKNVNQTALHIAAAMSNQDAMAILLANGAYLGEHRIIVSTDHGTILNALMPKTLNKTMDNCIQAPEKVAENTEDDILDPDYTLEMNYGFLLPPHEYTNSKKPEYHNEAAILFDVSQSKEHRDSLKHPLIQTLLYAKWRRVRPQYFLNLFIYFGFVLLLTRFEYTIKNLRLEEKNVQSGNITDDKLQHYQTQRDILMPIVLIITFYLAVKEGFQIYVLNWRTYFRSIENYLELFLILAVLITCIFPFSLEATRHIAAWTMIVAWYRFVLVLGRAPRLAMYITMLRHVSWNFLKLMFLFGFLIIAFSISFNIILQPDSESGGDFFAFWTTVPRAIVMATGEFEYSSISEDLSTNGIFAISTVLIFLVFLFLIFLVLMNVMTGLAVTDAKEIVEDALLYSLMSRLELVHLNEQLFLKVPCLRKLLPRVQLLSNTQRRLLVKINKYPKTERILYGEEESDKTRRCKLGNGTAAVLRSHRLKQLADAKAEREGDPTEKILSLLQELQGQIAAR